MLPVALIMNQNWNSICRIDIAGILSSVMIHNLKVIWAD